MNISLSAFVPENLVSLDGFGSPVPRQPAHLHTQAEYRVLVRFRRVCILNFSPRATLNTPSAPTVVQFRFSVFLFFFGGGGERAGCGRALMRARYFHVDLTEYHRSRQHSCVFFLYFGGRRRRGGGGCSLAACRQCSFGAADPPERSEKKKEGPRSSTSWMTATATAAAATSSGRFAQTSCVPCS